MKKKMLDIGMTIGLIIMSAICCIGGKAYGEYWTRLRNDIRD